MTALAIFVKTPGLSPLKTRLADGIGTEAAIEFHRRAAAAVGEVAHACMPELTPYWAVAEEAGLQAAIWHGFPTLWQGEGGLGARMDHIFRHLQTRHGAVLMVGADIPQVTPRLLLEAADRPEPYVIGPAEDGGFWLFGGRQPLPSAVWHETPYSRSDTGAQFAKAVSQHGSIGRVAELADVDRSADLPVVCAALRALSEPCAAQTALADWLDLLTALNVGQENRGTHR